MIIFLDDYFLLHWQIELVWELCRNPCGNGVPYLKNIRKTLGLRGALWNVKKINFNAMGIASSPNGSSINISHFIMTFKKIEWPFINTLLATKKEEMLIISCQQRITGLCVWEGHSLRFLLFYGTNTIIRILVGKIYFLHPAVLYTYYL